MVRAAGVERGNWGRQEDEVGDLKAGRRRRRQDSCCCEIGTMVGEVQRAKCGGAESGKAEGSGDDGD